MPPGGLADLRAAVAERVSAALCFDSRTATAADFNDFMRTLAASFFVDNVQGRAGGFHTMTFLQGQQLLRTAETLLDRSKTAARYGYQPVALGESSRNLLGCYLERVRCTATANKGDSSALWVNWDGTSYDTSRFGRLVSSFFKFHKQWYAALYCMHMCLVELYLMFALLFCFIRSINITRIRKMVETEVNEGVLRGTVTPFQQQQVHNVNGHSRATMERFYALNDRGSDGRLVRFAS
jgi:hypothetical protein